MTDREPDDLYDALRDRLADYGQEPPAPLWADIRAQLPPPVAQPQLRPKRRRVSVVLLLLLLITASGVGWNWWHNERVIGSVTTSKPDNTATNNAFNQEPANARTEVVAPVASANSATSGGIPQAGAASVSDAADAASVANSSKYATAADKTLIHKRSTENNGASSVAGIVAKAKREQAAKNAGWLATTSTAPASRRPGQRLNGRTDALMKAVGTISGQLAQGSRKPAAKGEAGTGGAFARNSPATNTASHWAAAKGAIASRAMAGPASSSTAIIAAPAAPPSLLTASATTSGKVTDRSENQAAQTVAAKAATGSLATATQHSANGNAVANPVSAEELARLPARNAALQLVAGPLLAQPRPTSTVPNTPTAIPLPRWAVQVLAGPALTYRQLSSSGLSNAATPNTANPIQYQYTQASVAELERPALGGGAQVNVRRALNGRWSLSAGLGYTEYAIRLALQQVQTPAALSGVFPNSSPGLDSAVSTTSVHQRDTYRFVTVPLRVGYAWPLTPRWTVGLLAGFDAAFYVGGTTTEGSACACQPQTWGASGSPYRRFSLGASLEAEVRYRLNGRWELLAQPTATYMLNPLAQSTSAYYERHLLGGTAWLGAAYTLP